MAGKHGVTVWQESMVGVAHAGQRVRAQRTTTRQI